MDKGTAMVPTKAGPAPLVNYQLAPTEGNFTVTCNVDLSKGPADIDAVPVTYPPFPISTVCPLFAVTQCTLEYQSLFDSLQLSEAEAAKLEQETLLQRNSDRWWTHRRSRLTASQFGDILSRKSISSAFLKGLVEQTPYVSSRNMPESLKHGIEHESTALRQYCNYLKHSGHPVKTFPSGFVVNPGYPLLGCSPDGKVIDGSEDAFGLIEIKCPYKHRAVTPETACHGDSQFHLEPKDDFPMLKKVTNITHKFKGRWA